VKPDIKVSAAEALDAAKQLAADKVAKLHARRKIRTPRCALVQHVEERICRRTSLIVLL